MMFFLYYSISAMNFYLSARSLIHCGERILKAFVLSFGSSLTLSLFTISAGNDIEFLTGKTRLGLTELFFLACFPFLAFFLLPLLKNPPLKLSTS